MALTDSCGMGPADMAAVLGRNNYNGNGGFGFGGDGAWWILILLLFGMNGGWGNGFGGGNMMPWLLNGQQNSNNDIQRSFDQLATSNSLNELASSFNNGQLNLLQTLNANQNSMNQGFYNMTSAFQNCCCENRLATANLGADIAREAAAGRAQTQATGQQIMDKLCQLELDGVKQNYENRISGMQNTIDALRTQINNARFDASQIAQTKDIENYLSPQARPAYVVQNPNGCNCGNNWFNSVA